MSSVMPGEYLLWKLQVRSRRRLWSLLISSADASRLLLVGLSIKINLAPSYGSRMHVKLWFHERRPFGFCETGVR